MKKLIHSLLFLLIVLGLCSFTVHAKEKTSGDFKYEVCPGGVYISGYTGSAKNVVIPEKIAGKKVVEIGNNAFKNCKNLTSMKLISRFLYFRRGSFENCNRLMAVDYEGTKEDWEGLFSGNDDSLNDCSFLRGLLIEKEVKPKLTKINSTSAKVTWSKVSGIHGYQIQIATDKSFKKIKKDIKINKQSTTSTVIKGIKTKNAYFVRIRAYKERKVEGKKVMTYTYWTETANDNYYYKTLKNGTLELTKYVGSEEKNITIPAKIRGKKVNTIGEYLFSERKKLENVKISKGIKKIGTEAFSDCTKLKSITIPDSVTSIGGRDFNECTSLKKVTIPKSVTKLGYMSFAGCESLSNVNLQCNIKTIGSYTFVRCKKLKEITIPSGVEKIKEYAFSACTNLKSITLPKSLKSIDFGAFYACKNLKTMNYKGTLKQWKSVYVNDWENTLLKKVNVKCKDGVIKAITK